MSDPETVDLADNAVKIIAISLCENRDVVKTCCQLRRPNPQCYCWFPILETAKDINAGLTEAGYRLAGPDEVVVPREPTDAMLLAVPIIEMCDSDILRPGLILEARSQYKAMIAEAEHE